MVAAFFAVAAVWVAVTVLAAGFGGVFIACAAAWWCGRASTAKARTADAVAVSVAVALSAGAALGVTAGAGVWVRRAPITYTRCVASACRRLTAASDHC